MKSGVARQLIEAYSSRDEAAFRKAALQLAASEAEAGHVKVAAEIRAALTALGDQTAVSPLDFGKPRGQISDLLSGGYREERLEDLVLAPETEQPLRRIIEENRNRSELLAWGVPPRRRVLLYGPPGCGKTLAAQALAGELGLPLLTARLDALFSRFLGATAVHLKTIFEEMPRKVGVYFFDEFDSIAKHRGDEHEVGEMRRVVTSFLQLMDADQSPGLILAATNYEKLLDRAVFRRFDMVVEFALPSNILIERLIAKRLGRFRLSRESTRRAALAAAGASFADVARACDDAVRTMVLSHRSTLTNEDLAHAMTSIHSRPSGQ